MTLQVNTLQALAEGVAEQLAADADEALAVTWQADGVYTSGHLGIYLAAVPTSPDRIIVLSPRQLTADPTLADAVYGLQTRFRGTQDPRVVWAIRDAVRDVIAGRWPTVLPNGLPIQCVDYSGGGSLGMDSSSRWEWADNWTYRLGEHRAQPF